MKRMAISALLIGALVAIAVPQVHVQPLPTNPNVHVHFTTLLENDPSRSVRLQAVLFLPGKGSEFHFHNGDEWVLIQESEVTLTIKGQAPRILKSGDTIYIPRGTVHRAQNLTDKPTHSLDLLIIDKDKPVQVLTD
jgi:quercetin dioxygenase-like cupin family protein